MQGIIILDRDHFLQPQVEQLMEKRSVGVTRGTDVVGEEVDPATHHHPTWLRPDWNLQSRNLAWVSNYRDWNDVLRDCLNLLKKPLKLLKR